MAFGKDMSSTPAQPHAPATATIVARETRFSGELSGTHPVRVEGTLHGTVQLNAAFEVAEGATVEAEIHAVSVRIAGRVVGNVTASDSVTLLASAVIEGNVTTPALHVVEGARLEGRVEMQRGPTGAPRAETGRNGRNR